jgi:prepilin-type N-terminal cleavage/methylation domain-containing protein
MIRRPASADFSRGFSLAELAVVLVIVALLLGGLVMPLSAQRDQQQTATTEATMREAVEALRGFAAAQGRAPCPAPAPGAVELPAGGHCAQASGYLPGPTLGLLALDAWGRPLRYAVATTYTNATTGTSYPADAATTTRGLLVPMPDLVTDLRACGDGTRYRYVISGAGTCAAPFSSIGDGLAVAIWSDGADATTTADDLVTWPALNVLAMMMTTGWQ